MKKALVLALAMMVSLLPQMTLPARAAESIDALDIEDLRIDDHVDMTGKEVEIVDAGTPTSYQVGYGVGENAVRDTAVVTLEGDTKNLADWPVYLLNEPGHTYVNGICTGCAASP